MNIEETFRYPVKSVPLHHCHYILAFPDLILRQNLKHYFCNYLIDIRKACRSTPLNEAHWIIDIMSVMRTIKAKGTYKEWFKTVIKFTLASLSLKPLSIEYVNDMYRGKIYDTDERGQSETRLLLQNLSFFHNIKNKQHLFSLLVTYLSADGFAQSSPLSILVNSANDTLKISFEYNHKEAKGKCSSLFKRYRCSYFGCLCLFS